MAPVTQDADLAFSVLLTTAHLTLLQELSGLPETFLPRLSSWAGPLWVFAEGGLGTVAIPRHREALSPFPWSCRDQNAPV